MAIKIDENSLEKALFQGAARNNPAPQPSANAEAPNISKDEEIGIHKGSLNTLAAERNELIKMIANVEMIMQAHLKRLEELGVKIQTEQK